MTDRIAIAGGGAAGMSAAIAAAENGAGDVVILEASTRLGRKILATGNGRCNLTNINAGKKNYHGKSPDFVLGAVKRFWVDETIDFFTRLGVLCKTEDGGRVYPYSDQASSVLDVLRRRIECLGIKVIYSFEVKKAEKRNGHFIIYSFDGREERAGKLIITTGGKAAPDLGSKGSGYDILKSFGHKITSLSPSLVQLKTETEIVRTLKGIKLNANVTLGKFSEYDEVLFADYGLSGPAVFSLTSRMDKEKVISLDIMSDYSHAHIKDIIYARMANNPNIPLEDFFTGMLNKRVGQAVLKCAGIDKLQRPSVTLGEKEIDRVCGVIKKWDFNITGTMSWNNAQVTKGGALTDEFNTSSMQSKLEKNLFAAGEVLDIDGDCGGYNLQWAWSSGFLAGLNAAK